MRLNQLFSEDDNIQYQQGHIPDDYSTEDRVNREPFETRQVRFQHGLYTLKAYDINTYDGPETKVVFYGPDGAECDTWQESASVDMIIQWWMADGQHGPERRRDETRF